MTHIKPITSVPLKAQGVTTPVESVILLLFTIFFQSYTNFSSVIQNLQKFYSKTP